CQRLVFHEAPPARWEDIDLSGDRRISDDQLRALLANASARERTRRLSLAGCANVRGTGLAPLRGSRVLEDVDLRVRGCRPLEGEDGLRYGDSGLDEPFVAGVLSSMLPRRDPAPGCPPRKIVLRRVAIRPLSAPSAAHLSNFSFGPDLRSFFFSFDFGLGRSIRCTRRPCSMCCVRTGEFEDFSCPQCDTHFCRACAMPPECSECSARRCQWCSNVVECTRCRKRSCAGHGYECCGGCSNVFCRGCEDELEFCMVCNEFYCTEDCHRGVHS
ncbi:hypothetical protein ACHAWF_001566, partial [Thalassiosira exigua]